MSFLFGFCCCDAGAVVPSVPPETVDTDCCLAVPKTLYASFSGGTGTCGTLDGTVVTLTYTTSLPDLPAQAGWVGTLGGSTIYFYCTFTVSYVWAFTTTVGSTGCQFAHPGVEETSCSPFLTQYLPLTIGNCCLGTSDVAITGISP